MECIVTAGPSYEPLDQARRITNFSTGRLGCELANHLHSGGHSVHLLLGEQASWRGSISTSNLLRFSTGSDLASKIQSLSGRKIAAVFHAAAVADFRPVAVFRRDSQGTLERVGQGKVATSGGPILVEMEPTPKILGKLREWFPEALIVGWKYEVDGDRADVVELAVRQIRASKTNACVANGPAFGPGYGLVLPDGLAQEFADAPRLFQKLGSLMI